MVDENVIPPEPDCMAVVDVVFVDPIVNDFTAPPVPIFNVVFDASVEIPMVPVPEFILISPLVAVIDIVPSDAGEIVIPPDVVV